MEWLLAYSKLDGVSIEDDTSEPLRQTCTDELRRLGLDFTPPSYVLFAKQTWEISYQLRFLHEGVVTV